MENGTERHSAWENKFKNYIFAYMRQKTVVFRWHHFAKKTTLHLSRCTCSWNKGFE